MKLSQALAARGRTDILYGMTDPAYSVLVAALDGEYDAPKHISPIKVEEAKEKVKAPKAKPLVDE